MNIQFQRIRFEKQFGAIPLNFDEDTNKYQDTETQLRFDGWCKCAESLELDKVSMYFSRTYGWCFEKLDGNGIEHPEFDEKFEALDWAKERGLLVVESEL